MKKAVAVLCVVGTSAMISATTWGAGKPTVVNKAYGFSFSLPHRWYVAPLNGKDLGYFLDEAAKKDPSMKSYLTNEVKKETEQGVKEFAVGPLVGTFAPNINVIVVSSAGTPRGAAFFTAINAQAKVELTAAGCKKLNISKAKLRFGTVERATYYLTFKGSKQRVQGLQIYFLHTNHVYIVTFTTTSQAKNDAVMARVADTWRWS